MKELKDKQEAVSGEDEHCSETDDESDILLTAKCSGDKIFSKKHNFKRKTHRTTANLSDDDDTTPLASVLPEDCLHIDDDAPLASVLPAKCLPSNDIGNKIQERNRTETLSDIQRKDVGCLEKTVTSLNGCSQERRSRKRPRVVLIDDEDIQESDVAADIGSENHAFAKADESLVPREEPDDMISPYMDSTAIHVVNDQPETSEMESVKSGNLNPEGVDMKFTSQSEMHSFLEDHKGAPTIEDNTNTLTIFGETNSISSQVSIPFRISNFTKFHALHVYHFFCD